MPPRPTLKIAEIFAGLQGEGLRMGRPSIFVRLAGCNLRCSFCDTKYAWRGGRAMSAATIAAQVKRLGRRKAGGWICLTGGEPLAQDVGPLVNRLRHDGFRVQVETNGTMPGPGDIDWVTISPKPPDYAVIPSLRRRAREIKLVVSRELNLSVIRRVRAEIPAGVPIFLQPESNLPESRAQAVRLVRKTTAEGLDDIRLGVQLHRIYGFR